MLHTLRFNRIPQSFHLINIGALALVAILSLSSCAAISPAPFNSLSSSIQQLREGADSSLSIVNIRTRERYIAEAASGNLDKRINALLLNKPEGELFGWISSDPPLFLKAAQFREGIYRLNSVLVDYTALLAQLASPDLVDPQIFEQLAKDLNGNLKTATQSLTPKAPDKEIAIFSTASTAAFRAYLQSKQRSSLIDALKANQLTFSKTAHLGALAVRMETQALRNEYDIASKNLADKLNAPAFRALRKEEIFRELVELDEKFIKELFLMNTLHQSYLALPSAHRELAVGLADPKLSLPMVQEILENSRQLHRLYEELRKQNMETKVVEVAS